MDEFHLDMGVRFTPDENSVKEIDKLFDSFRKIKVFGGDEGIAKIREQFDDYNTRRSSLQQAQSMLDQYRTVQGKGDKFEDATTRELMKYMQELIDSNESLKEEFGQNFKTEFDESTEVMIGNLKSQFLNKLSSLAQSFLSSIGNLFKDAWSELGTMLQSSLLTNANTRENAFNYGFSASESYGFDKAKQMLGIQSEEDLWYMNDTQKSKFQEIMTKYSEKYEQLYDSGFFDKYLQFQIEMEEFKLDMQMEIIEFFMENKNTIKKFMELSMSAMEFIVNALGWLMDFFGGSEQTSDEEKLANINDIIGSYTSNNGVVNQTFSNNNTFNGTTDSQKQAYLDMLNAQMVEAKKGLGG